MPLGTFPNFSLKVKCFRKITMRYYRFSYIIHLGVTITFSFFSTACQNAEHIGASEGLASDHG
jgi:hypothetical protein